MFNFTLPELVVIFIVALIVFGPKRLPEIGRALGRGIGEVRRSLQGLKEQIHEEMDAPAVQSPKENPPVKDSADASQKNHS